MVRIVNQENSGTDEDGLVVGETVKLTISDRLSAKSTLPK